MSRLNVRRRTAGLLLGLAAAPASAAPAGWSFPTVDLGPAWVGQVLTWLRSLLPGGGRERQGTGNAHSGSRAKTMNQPPLMGTDGSIAVDPNGSK